MSYRKECERAIKRHYEVCPADIGILRSALADAAHICDAMAKDFIEQNRSGKRQPSAPVKEVAYHITRVGNAIFELRDKLLPNPSKGSDNA